MLFCSFPLFAPTQASSPQSHPQTPHCLLHTPSGLLENWATLSTRTHPYSLHISPAHRPSIHPSSQPAKQPANHPQTPHDHNHHLLYPLPPRAHLCVCPTPRVRHKSFTFLTIIEFRIVRTVPISGNPTAIIMYNASSVCGIRIQLLLSLSLSLRLPSSQTHTRILTPSYAVRVRSLQHTHFTHTHIQNQCDAYQPMKKIKTSSRAPVDDDDAKNDDDDDDDDETRAKLPSSTCVMCAQFNIGRRYLIYFLICIYSDIVYYIYVYVYICSDVCPCSHILCMDDAMCVCVCEYAQIRRWYKGLSVLKVSVREMCWRSSCVSCGRKFFR